jgi:hypothetical protein
MVDMPPSASIVVPRHPRFEQGLQVCHEIGECVANKGFPRTPVFFTTKRPAYDRRYCIINTPSRVSSALVLLVLSLPVVVPFSVLGRLSHQLIVLKCFLAYGISVLIGKSLLPCANIRTFRRACVATASANNRTSTNNTNPRILLTAMLPPLSTVSTPKFLVARGRTCKSPAVPCNKIRSADYTQTIV